MLFNSFEFILVFLPLTCIIFFYTQRNNNLALSILLIASLGFYAYHSMTNLYIMLSSIVFNFIIGHYIYKNKKILILGIIVNIIAISYFKYSFFIIENLNNLISNPVQFEKVILPLGISFFTFQQIAYLIDTYYGNKPESNFISYALLVSFFPHSIAGPLVQYKEIAPQFHKARISSDSIGIGGTIFIIGLFKKIIIADGLAPCTNAVFDAAAQHVTLSFIEAWMGAICYTLQLYFDFSGYSDMALGLAKIFNINFPLNFDSPYKATSIIDFWRRWHITLSNFLKNYLYIPLGGNKNGARRKLINLFLTMLIGGIWHGANWTFIIWGSLHGIYLIVNHLWRKLYLTLNLNHAQNKFYIFISWVITILCIILAWVIFRSQDIYSALNIYKSMLGVNGISLSPSLESFGIKCSFINYQGFFSNQLFTASDYIPLLLISCFICLLVPNIKDFFSNVIAFEPKNNRERSSTIFESSKLYWAPSKAYAFLSALMTAWVTVALLSARKVEFLYFDF